jgi:hypothetical protein
MVVTAPQVLQVLDHLEWVDCANSCHSANVSERPVAHLPDEPGTGGEHQKAGVGVTGRMRQKIDSHIVARAEEQQFDQDSAPSVRELAHKSV